MRDAAANDAVVLFVGTKKQAADAVKEESRTFRSYYINHRWLGGTLLTGEQSKNVSLV